MYWITNFLLLGAALCLVEGSFRDERGIDVREGENVKLVCTISNPNLIEKGMVMWRMQGNNQEQEVVAIDDIKYHSNYQPELNKESGNYTLLIPNSQYDRDNGVFDCLLKEQNTGEVIHRTTINLTVLIPPSSPQISPISATATEGEAIDLTCSSIGGSPDPEITWFRKGSNEKLQSMIRPGGGKDFATTSVLTVVPRKEDDGIEYRCKVWNRALEDHEKMESSVRLNVNYFPRITIGPENPLRVIRGRSAQMTCEADAKPTVDNVRWKRNGRYISTENRYQINAVNIMDAGQYMCEADNKLGRTEKSELTLDVLYGPIVHLNNNSNEVEEGDDIIIKCNVSANPAPITIEWLKEGDENFRQSGDVLRLSRVTSQNQGDYICRAVNTLNPTNGDKEDRVGNATVAIRIQHAPGKTVITPNNPIAVQGESITLSCGANPPGWPKPTYRWWKQQKPDANIKLSENYTITRASSMDEGTYFCEPSNSYGKGTKASVDLKVYQAPRILEKLSSREIRKSGTTDVSLTCQAQGSPQPSIEWKKNGKIINESDGMYDIDVKQSKLDSGLGHTVQSTLAFKGTHRIGKNQLMAQDRGLYQCIFKNEIKEISSSQNLIVEHAPVIVHKQKKVAYDLAEEAKIECRMQAFPEPDFQWSYDLTYFSKNQQIKTKTDNDIYSSVLTINAVDENDYGEYTCKGTNDIGTKKTIIKLQPKGKPEHPENLQIEQFGTDFIELSWTEGFNGGFKNTKFMVTTQSSHGTEDYDCQTNNPCVIENLKQQTRYFIQVQAYNDKGRSEYSEEIEGITKIDIESIPLAEDVFFEEGNHVISFKKVSTSLILDGFVEVLYQDSDWSPLPERVTLSGSYGEMKVPVDNLEGIRVRLCSQGSTTICGPFREAKFVTQLPSRISESLSMEYMIAIILGVVAVVACGVLVVICCCCRKRNSKLKKKAAELDVNHRGVATQQAPPPPYYTIGLENKGMEDSLENGMDSHPKSAIYNPQQYHSGYGHNTHIATNTNNGIGGYIDNSYSNSNNGGSVNSQDSLWQVKEQNQAPQGPPPNHGYQYDPVVHGGYGITGYDDYSPYPPSPHHQQQHHQPQNMSDDFPRVNYGSNGDPYAAVHKPKKRMDQPDGYDVSGMPDPYMGHDPNLQALPELSPDQKPPLNFDESLESGYSTPNSRNRRIIREIIV